jgi:outer membrane protein assembly factor BamB
MRSLLIALAVGTFLLAQILPALADNWPAWRGPAGTGIAAEKNVPLRWSPTENVKWKVELPGPGNSTPIVWEEQVFLTCANEGGKERGLYAYDRQTGNLKWSQVVPYDKPETTHDTNPACSASPVTDGEQVIAWHGSAGVYAYDLQGKELWHRDLGSFEHIWGNAASPVIYKQMVLLSCGPGLNTFLIALDKASGEELWRVTPPEATSEKLDEFRGSWSTPVLHAGENSDEFLLSLPNRLVAFDPTTGAENWSCQGLSKLAYTSPLVGEGVAVAMSGYHGPALAVKTGGKGNVTETHRLWLHTEKIPQRIGSGVIVAGHIYMLNESGVVWCLDLKSGEMKWEERLGTRGGKSWSSISYVDGRLYVLNMGGETIVFEPNPEKLVVLAENPLGELTRSSLAFSNGQVFVRTYKHLWCIEEKAE